MATYYGLHCRTCGEHSPTWFRSDPEQVAELVRHYPTLKAIDALCDAAELPWWIEVQITFPGIYDEPPTLFLAGHYGHELTVYGEYGRDCPEIALPENPKKEAN
jgi:hypothetical protein